MKKKRDSSALERFLRYVSIDTRSSAETEETPSTAGQMELGRLLRKELEKAGAKDAVLTEKGYVYGHLPATEGLEKVPCFGFIAHMDTSDAASGKNVKPRLVKYTGKPVPLGKSGRVLEEKRFPGLASLRGDTLLVTDGTTLLGADDKAGCAEIVSALERIVTEKIPHGPLSFAFTPDEEIGRGMDHFQPEKFGASFAFTVDGDAVDVFQWENFNAAEVVLSFQGIAVHPGSAKGKMVNALSLAWEFHSLLPPREVPEKTEQYDGFFFLHAVEGTSSQAKVRYLLRDHDAIRFRARKKKVEGAVRTLRKKYGKETVTFHVEEQYRNMAEVLKKVPFLKTLAFSAMKEAFLAPRVEPIRGGTDGARLSYMGVPCPNLGTGGGNFHGEYEFVSVEKMEKSVEILRNIVKGAAKKFAKTGKRNYSSCCGRK
ncbi:MAG: peptidase T [Lentisphaeria bacterium]|nr:peptidase T [Lentisphaeria bacterium]